MRNVLGPETVLGYCTNVHAGQTIEQVCANLERHALPVKAQVGPEEPMGVGLWLPASAAYELDRDDAAKRLRDWLNERGLLAYTFNGFPFGDFHSDVVKHDVYRPTWADDARLEYTLRLVDVLDVLLPEGDVGSISTLPIGWHRAGQANWAEAPRPRACHEALTRLAVLVRALADFEAERGRLIHVDIEPEPGCVLDVSDDVVDMFDALDSLCDGEQLRRYLRVCHDTCHAEVMGEEHADVLAKYRAHGINVGKVQISAAVRMQGAGREQASPDEAINQLRAFDEPRYLHQTRIAQGSGEARLYEDLPEALAAWDAGNVPRDAIWTTHFHVPIYLESFGQLQTTQRGIVDCLHAINHAGDDVTHYEVETYAWNVLPESLQEGELSDGIAKELAWVKAMTLSKRPSS